MTRQRSAVRGIRRGNILTLSAVLMVVMFTFIAFSVDMGMAYINRTEMQRTADAAAIATATHLLDQQMLNPTGTQSIAEAESEAVRFASLNRIGEVTAPRIADGDIEIGRLVSPHDPSSSIVSVLGASNTARVRIRRTADVNGETRFVFARVLGHHGVAQEVNATASYVSGFRGFGVASSGGNLGILPFTLDNETWDDLQDGTTSDDWTWDSNTKTITAGPDGVYEVNLFPQDTGMPGNRGTVDIGHSGNSTADIKRQILDGISPSDLEHHGGKLEFDSNNELVLNGDTGISAAVKTQLTTIMGEPRIIPIFEQASGNGNNANYTITKFMGIRIMEVKLTGAMNKKRVIVQPASIRTLGGIPDNSSAPPTQYIFSPVSLIQ